MLRLAAVISCLSAAACVGSDTRLGGEWLTVGGGTSYGMCVGFCRRSLAITVADGSWEARFYDFQTEPPPHLTTGVLSTHEAQYINDLVGAIDVPGLADHYGCPDCSDGGAGQAVFVGESGERAITTDLQRPDEVPDDLRAFVGELQSLLEPIAACVDDLRYELGPGCEALVL